MNVLRNEKNDEKMLMKHKCWRAGNFINLKRIIRELLITKDWKNILINLLHLILVILLGTPETQTIHQQRK